MCVVHYMYPYGVSLSLSTSPHLKPQTTSYEFPSPAKHQSPNCRTATCPTLLACRCVPRTPTFCYGYNAPVPSTKKSLTTFCPKTTCNQPSNTSIPSHQPRPLSTPLHLFPTHSIVPTHWPLTGRRISPTRRLLN